MNKILVIIGPTAVGKSDLAFNIARAFDGELVACDSRQVYKYLDIGTGKEVGSGYDVTKGSGYWVVNGVRIWMYDLVDSKEQYNVSDYVKRATEVIEDILLRGKLPIIVGGTGLYLRGLLGGIETIDLSGDRALRSELEGLSVEELRRRLKGLSPAVFEKLNQSDVGNKRRLIRKIEIESMNPYIRHKGKKAVIKNQKWDVLKIGLTLPRSALDQAINSRTETRFNLGLIKEGEKLIQDGLTLQRMRQLGLEYSLLADYMEKKISSGDLLCRLKIKNRQLSKRQLTWFKKETDINWFDVSLNGWIAKVEKLVGHWYNAPNDQKDRHLS